MVYLAELEEERSGIAPGARVAVKVLHPALVSDPYTFERFTREGHLGLGLNHPGLVRTLAAETHVEGAAVWHFLILEYVEGRTLSEVIEELGAVPEALLRDIAYQTVRALAVIHEAGALHRDLKPANLLVTSDHQLKLVDLGIAHFLEAAIPLTAAEFVGSPAYASPEQFQELDLTPASDLYSLGAVLHEAATGAAFFQGRDFAAMMHGHLKLTPPPLSEGGIRCSPFLERVVSTLLKKDPRQRFESAAALAVVLEEGEESSWWQQTESSAHGSVSAESILTRLRSDRKTPLVERGEELASLAAAHRSAREGRGRVILVEGEAGVGKTRLLQGFVESLSEETDPVTVLHGSNPPGGEGGGRGALASALLAHERGAELIAWLECLLSRTRGLAPAFAAHLSGRQVPPDAEPLERECLPTMYCEVLEGLRRRGPVAWLVEDLHFATGAERSWVLALARLAADLGALLVLTTRPGLEAETRAYLERLEATTLMALPRLSEASVHVLLETCSGSGELAAQLTEPVHRRTDGNPYFVLEMLEELESRGALERREDGSYGAVEALTTAEIPSSVRSLLTLRLTSLTEEERQVLDVGCLQGLRFDPDLTSRVLERRRLAVLQDLGALERRTGLVRSRGALYEFDHHLLQELLDESLSGPLKHEYHALLGDAHAERCGLRGVSRAETSGRDAVTCCRHWLLGRRFQNAAPLVLRALAHLEAEHRLDELLELADLALTELPRAEMMLRCDVALAASDASCELIQLDRAIQRAAEAGATAQEFRDDSRYIRSELAMAQASLIGRNPFSTQQLEALVGRCQELGDVRLEMAAEGIAAKTYRSKSDHRAALSHASRQCELATSIGDGKELVSGQREAGLALVQVSGRVDEGLALLQMSLEASRSTNDRHEQARSLLLIETAHYRLAQWGQAIDNSTQGLAVSRAIGHRALEFDFLISLTDANLSAGDLGSARSYLNDAEQLLPALGLSQDSYGAGSVAILVVVSTPWRPRLENAVRLFAHEATHADLPAAYALSWLALIALSREDLEQADAFVRSAAEFARDRLPGVWTWMTALAAIISYELGDAESAVDKLESIKQAPGAHPTVLADAYLVLLGERPISSAVVSDRAACWDRAEAHLALYRAGADGVHLRSCRELVKRRCRHLQGEHLDQFWHDDYTARRLVAAENGSLRS